ncbi:MAG: palindromic element RPE4 domain-containing protein [Rickettsia conorii subsp. raoultii]
MFYCFLDPVVKPRGDTQGIVPFHATKPRFCGNDIE